ncbi:MAG: twin-arginine translocase subunit TatC [Haloferacaceae archaeon]
MGDAPDPRDDAGSEDDEGVEQSEPTESAAAPADDPDDGAPEHTADEGDEGDANGDDVDAGGAEDDDTGEAEPETTAADDATDASDETDTADASDDADTADAGDDTDTSEEDAASPDDADTADASDDESTDDADSFGTPPESTFDSGEDWVDAMNDDESGDGEPSDSEPAGSAAAGDDESPESGDDSVDTGDGDSDDATETDADGSTIDRPELDYSGGAEEPPEPAVADPVEDEPLEGPASDQEMPLAVHIEEMVRRLAIVLGVAGVVTLVAYPLSERLIEYLWTSYIPQPLVNRPHVYGPLEFVLTKLKVAGLSGTVVGLPVFVYETYRFMKPGLYPHERRYYLASVPTSLILAFVGVAFSHFVILPLTILYFTSYTSQAAIVAFGLRETFNLIVLMMGYMAIIFQIPLFVMLAIMMGLVTREWMEDKRLLFWGGFGGLAFTFVTVDPTGMAPIIIAVTMIVLFEGTLALLRWTGN